MLLFSYICWVIDMRGGGGRGVDKNVSNMKQVGRLISNAQEIIAQTWEHHNNISNPCLNLFIKLDKCKHKLQRWQKGTAGTLNRALTELREQLTSLQGHEGYLDTVQDAQLKNEFLDLLEEDDLRWQQRAKVN
jgi:hypothetical protein